MFFASFSIDGHGHLLRALPHMFFVAVTQLKLRLYNCCTLGIIAVPRLRRLSRSLASLPTPNCKQHCNISDAAVPLCALSHSCYPEHVSTVCAGRSRCDKVLLQARSFMHTTLARGIAPRGGKGTYKPRKETSSFHLPTIIIDSERGISASAEVLTQINHKKCARARVCACVWGWGVEVGSRESL